MSKDQFSFRTIAKPAEGSYREKGSRFLAFAFPVLSEEEINDHLAQLQRKYHDARHHCYAWRLGAEGERFRAFDAGEPNHSAGDPILGQIRSKDLTNVLVVVVRYFGGVKLGVGGLVTAYKTAAEDALANAVIVEREIVEPIVITYDYAATADVMRLVREFSLQIRDQQFGAQCKLMAEYSARHKERLLSKLSLMTAMGVNVSYEMRS